MKKIVLLLLMMSAIVAHAGLTGQLEIRVISSMSNDDSSGSGSDQTNIEKIARFYEGETHGAIDTVFRDERIVSSASVDTLGMVGSLSNALGEVATFATVKGLYVENRSATGTLIFSSGIATTTLMPCGLLLLLGSYPVSTSFDRIAISTIATSAITYRIWIVGTR